MDTTLRDRDIIKRYLAGELLQPLADSYGISRQRVWQIVKGNGKVNYNRKNTLYTCHRCGKEFRKPNCQRHGRFSYCSSECYYAQRGLRSLHRSNTEQRRGNRQARRVVSRYFELQPHHVIHHFDRNQLNNDPTNLAAFSSHREHLAYHHWQDSGSIGDAPSAPIWIL